MSGRVCGTCGTSIDARRAEARYCSNRCYELGRRAEHAAKRRDHYRTNKVRDLAHTKAGRADLPRPMFCEACGIKPPRDRHHDDYSKPLEIRWLCRSCHMRWHAANPDPLAAT